LRRYIAEAGRKRGSNYDRPGNHHHKPDKDCEIATLDARAMQTLFEGLNTQIKGMTTQIERLTTQIEALANARPHVTTQIENLTNALLADQFGDPSALEEDPAPNLGAEEDPVLQSSDDAFILKPTPSITCATQLNRDPINERAGCVPGDLELMRQG
jgi:hypothetical protein